ncbi:pantoate--beta-alanine ligase [Moheibacter sediminis]|uniref:Pantothenate synthetase n=1 Tax=Moheibacter sediminis TaxID=1434700 RepID=A0A1W1Y9A9_9FLAO|nr:pantoate--beta-alanine ligase [Moheibacter sediminis]SMC32725.1 pantothenate synthetase [Moheibacter sediminis]
MILIKSLGELQSLIQNQKNLHNKIGFVPTMGALHDGHISLVKDSVEQNDFTIVSIFVNPTQFNNKEDLKKYPRTEEADIEILKNSGCDAIFFPKVEDIYPEGEKSEIFSFDGIEHQMEGKFRPGHFDGVATVVNRFFEIIEPDKAYFGEKDFQQLRIIQELVKKLNLNVQIVPVSIMRENDGLAMSSRNMRLTKEMRKESPKIYQILSEAKEFLKLNSIAETKNFVQEKFNQTKLELEYFEIAEEKTLAPASEKENHKNLRGFIAVFAGEIRLIDNISLN